MADYDNVNELQAPGQERYIVQYFRGINDHTRISEGYWQKMLNLSTEEYPVAMARQARKKAKYYTTWEIKRCMVSGSMVDYELVLQMELTLAPGITPPSVPFVVKVLGRTYTVTALKDTTVGTDAAKTLVIEDYSKAYDIASALRTGRVDALYTDESVTSMGLGKPVDAVVIDDMIVTAYERGQIAYGDKVILVDTTVQRIVAMGRKIYTDKGALLNTGTDESVNTGVSVKVDGANYTVAMVDAGGATVTVATGDKPSSPEDGDYWYDSVRDGLYQWSDGQQEWIAIPTMYTKITLPSTADLSGLKAGDAVEATIERYKSSYIVHSVDDTNHWIILRGLLYPIPQQLLVGVIIERKMPVLDYICEHENRIWGCRYGENADGEFVNEIYACAQGDPTNWYLFEGTSADSWMTSVGAPGKWTGIKECGEYLCFFKENCVFIVSGSTPASFRYARYDGDGVQDGCDRSIQNIRGSLYYKSCHGIRKLTPYSYPQDVSEELGEDRWTDAIAGTDGTRFYVRMTDADGTSVYIYDTETGFWTRENAPDNMYLMLNYMNEVMALCGKEGTVFAYAGYDASAAEHAEPLRKDYDSVPEYVTAYLAWTSKKLDSITAAGLSVIEQCSTWNVTTPAALEAYVDTLNESGYFFSKKNFWNIDYILLHSAGRNKTPYGYAYNANSFDATVLEGEWIECDVPEWYGETGTMGLALPDEKRVRIIQMRVKTSENTRMRIYISYDESGKWEEIWAINKGKTGTYRIAYTPARRNDTFRLRIEGSGPAVIYSITYQAEDGGDRNVC